MTRTLGLGMAGFLLLGCTPLTGGQGGGGGGMLGATGSTGSTSATTGDSGTPAETTTTTAADSTTGSTTEAPPADDTMSSSGGEPQPFFRRELTIHADEVPGDAPLEDFTVLVTFMGDDGLRHVDAGGNVLELDAADLVFRDASLQPLARDLVSYAPESGRMAFWVRVPEVAADVDTTLWLDYGASSLVGQSPPGAWNEGYVGVWRFEGDVSDGGEVPDSSASGHHGTAIDMSAANGVPGRVGRGVSFTQATAAIRVSGAGLDLPGPVTLEGWGRMNGPLATSGFQRLFHKGGDAYPPLALLVADATYLLGDATVLVNYAEPVDYVDLSYTVPGFAYEQWHHYAAVVGGPGDEVVLFVDGARVASTTFADPITTGLDDDLYFGNWGVQSGGTRQWNGVLDELRYSSVARSDQWLEASFRTQAQPQMFCTVGAEQAMQ